jgi:hypothetical protein
MIVPATDVMFIIGGLLLLGYKHLSRPCADHAEPRPAQGPQSRHTAQYRMAGIAHYILRPFVEARNGGVGPISCRTWWIGRVQLGPILSVGGPSQSPGWGLPARGGRKKECIMDDPFSSMQNPARRAERYRQVAAEYSEWAKDASSPTIAALPRSTGCGQRAN